MNDKVYRHFYVVESTHELNALSRIGWDFVSVVPDGEGAYAFLVAKVCSDTDFHGDTDSVLLPTLYRQILAPIKLLNVIYYLESLTGL